MPCTHLLRISSNTLHATKKFIQNSNNAAALATSVITNAAHEAFDAFSDRRPTKTTDFMLISSLLSLVETPRDFRQVMQLHGLVFSLGLHENSFFLRKLVSLYVTAGSFLDARLMAESSVVNGVLAWSVLIYAYSRSGHLKDAIFSYERMIRKGLVPNKFTYSAVLRVCAEMNDLVLGREVHFRMVGSCVELDVCVWNALVAMYAKCGDVVNARKVFDEMKVRDSVTWNSMILGYTSKGMWENAFQLLKLMPEDLANTVTWNTVLTGLLRRGNHDEVLRLISLMRVRGIVVDHVTVVIGLKACSISQSLKLGKEIHGLAIYAHFDGIQDVVNALITMYCRCQDTNHAYMLFRISQSQNLVTWNAMISGFVSAGQAEEASLLFKEMMGLSIQLNCVTILSMLSLCLRTSNLKHGQELHCFITRHGMEDNVFLANSLIAMYSKVGKMTAAKGMFVLITYHDIVSYTALIAGYGLQGEGITSLKLFNEMISTGITPDHITMVAILSACGHSGLVTQGQLLFEHMTAVYGIEPRVEHFSCMVDLYCRVGLVRRAEEIIARMPLLPSTAMLATLIIACLIQSNIAVGVRAAKKLLQMKSNNPSHYTIMCDMFASARYWEDLVEVKKLIRNMRSTESAGSLWFDARSEAYTAIATDLSNAFACDNSTILYKLVDQMRDSECVSDEEIEIVGVMK